MNRFTNLIQTIKSYEIYINFIIILVFPLLFITLGMDFTDGPFSYSMTRSPETLMPFWLTSKIGNLWSIVFSYSILSNRVLNYLITEGIIFSFLYSFFQIKNRLIFTRFAVLAIILTISTSSQTYTYGTSTLLCLTGLFICFLKYIATNKLSYIFYCGIISVAALLSRFPNIVLLPAFIIFFGIFSLLKKKNTPVSNNIKLQYFIKLNATYVSACLLTLSFFFLLFKSPVNYFTSITDNLGAFSKTESSHSLSTILNNYFRDLILIAKYITVLVAMLITYNLVTYYTKFNKWILIIVFSIGYLWFLHSSNSGIFNFGFSLNITAFILFIVFTLAYYYYKKSKHVHLFILLYITLLIFIAAIGSNTGLLKTKSFSSVIIIILLFWLFKSKQNAGIPKAFLTILIFSFTIYGIYTRTNWFYGETRDIHALRYTINHENLQHISTTIYRKNLVEKVTNAIDALGTNRDGIVFFGSAGQMFYYLYEMKPLSKQLFYLESDDNSVLKQLETSIQHEHKSPIVVIVYGNANLASWPQYLSESANIELKTETKRSANLVNMLQNNNYQIVSDEKTFLVLTQNELKI